VSSRSNVSLGLLSLFTSFGTLVCCALPSLFVLVGFGTAVASVLSAAPWLVALSHRKDWVFVGSGAVIALNFAYVYWTAMRPPTRILYPLLLRMAVRARGARRERPATSRGALRGYQGAAPLGWFAPRLRGVQPCPGDGLAACETADRASRVVLWIAAATYLAGFFAAYLVGPILTWLHG
jgi:mercuric ion transport protein